MTGIAITALLLVIFNVLMWFIFLHKFNRFFSTDRIVEDTRNAINEKIREANNAAERNMQLIDDKIQQLNKVKADAERRLSVLKRELNNQQRIREFQESMASAEKSAKKSSVKKSAVSTYNPNDQQGELVFTDKAREELGIPAENVPSVDNMQEQDHVVSIPVISPEYIRAENPIVSKKDFPQQVRELVGQGLPVDEIARRTGRSVQEVRLVIQMF